MEKLLNSKETLEMIENLDMGKLKLEDIFILTGFQEKVNVFYQIIDVFFLPSLYEGLPMVLLEAMAFKKAVISMNVGSISEVIKNKIISL